jgi:cytochrome c-type biogenesis protein CcmH/NrfF
LWLGPPALLLAGALTLFVLARRKSGMAREAGEALTPVEEARLAKLVDEPEG